MLKGDILLQQIIILLTPVKKENKSTNISSSTGRTRISLVNKVDISQLRKQTKPVWSLILTATQISTPMG